MTVWKQVLKFVLLHRKELIVTTISLLAFTLILLFSNQLVTLWSTILIKKEGASIKASIQQELAYIFEQREEIISSRILNDAIKNKDLSSLSIFLQVEVKKRNLDFIVVTDRDGFVLARSGTTVQQGDNVFQTMIQGRNVSRGETVTTIIREVRNPLTSISASYIFEQNSPIGSILVGQIFNNAYATRFQEKYLKQGGQIVFYTPQEGIVGDSFNNKDNTQLISAYFSLGSDLVAQNLTGLSREVKIGDTFYSIRNIVFPGVEESPGGAFVFFPIHHSFYSLFLAGSITLLLFLLFFFFKILNHHKHQTPVFLLICFILFTALYFITLIKLDNSAIKLKKSPYVIYNSVMRFDPESDVIIQSSEKTVAIKVFTGGEAINAVSAIINYDPKVVEVLEIVTTNSFCAPSFFLEKEINKEEGEVRIVCTIPNPGFSDPIGIVAELLVQPLGPKAISLEFAEGTHVLANDGLGTNVLRMVTSGYYQIVRQKFAISDIQNPIPIFSASHPNSNRWYKNKNIKLSWPELSGGTYFYTLNRNPDSSAEDKILSTTSNYLDTVIDEGIYYFHLQAKNVSGKFGPISSFKIMVDNTPPLPPEIRVSSETINRGEVARLDFTSSDALSGLQSGFYVKVNEGILLPVKPPFYMPFIKSGEYPVVVRVFDKANNFSDSPVVIHVSN